jgi:hypothetical protein
MRGRQTLLAAALGLAACASGPAPAAPAAPTTPPLAASPPLADASAPGDGATSSTHPASREERLIAKMLRRVVVARGLEARRPVPGVVLDRTALLARVKEHLSRELPPEAIRNEGLALQLFGFLPPAFDYEAAEYQLLEDQLAGYYEPSDGTMYMAGDLGEPEAEATLAHELVHALQDQRWDLAARCKYHPGDGDRASAVSALAEGDATSAMFDVLVAQGAKAGAPTVLDVPDEVFSAQIRDGMQQGPGAAAPRIMRASLAAPYIYGTLFVHALRRGGGWAQVDRAWDDPPATTEQVLHVDKWRAHERPLAVAVPTYAALGEGWTAADEDSEGELGTRIAFEEWMDPRKAAELAAGWGGDRGLLLTAGDRVAYAWRLRYDADGAREPRAATAFKALRGALENAVGAFTTRDASFACRARADRGPLALALQGSDLVLTMGPARTSPGSWQSAGDCALARRWTKEIAAAR